MTIIALDTETTTYSTGNPFDSRNKLCLVGTTNGNSSVLYDIEYSDTPYRESINLLRSSIESASLIVLFNAKFDLNWLRRYGIDYSNLRIWDCQLVHFILTNQTEPYPSLNGVAAYNGLGSKIDKIKEYWEAGVQTDDIPLDELSEYLVQDISLTLEIYKKQVEQLSGNMLKLVRVSNQDTLVLADMEYNGLKYDFDVSQKRAETITEQLAAIDEQLSNFYGYTGINWNSNDHLSAILYGGVLRLPYRETYERVLKDGTVKVRERNALQEIEMERLVTPLAGTECSKEGYWKTAEDILRSLKAKGKAKEIIKLVLERSVLDKELNTYSLGLPRLYKEKCYTDEIIHGSFNQCVARTGRLSSSSPNLQNLSQPSRECFITRYGLSA